jgi:hypothetical protein
MHAVHGFDAAAVIGEVLEAGSGPRLQLR